MPKTNINPENIEIASFVKEVATYFKYFLETDFKAGGVPKRNTKPQSGLKVGIDLEKYSRLKEQFFKLLNSGFKKETLKVKKGEYVSDKGKILFNSINEAIENISEKDLNEIFKEIETLAKDKKHQYVKEKKYDEFLEEIKEETNKIFLTHLSKLLKNLAGENNQPQLEDITSSIFENKYTEILQHFFNDEEGFDLRENLQEIVELAELKNNLTNFFKIALLNNDAFLDISVLYRNNKLSDKTEIYLYFYELSIGSDKFPVFYMPVEVQKEEKMCVFRFENRIFVNTKAIEYVVKEWNSQTKDESTLHGEFERILYLSADNSGFVLTTMKRYIQKMEDFFQLSDYQSSKSQKRMNSTSKISFSDKSYLCSFDKSDEALINDYEEILSDSSGDIFENFYRLLEGFIIENPKSFIEEVENEWRDKDYPQRLIFESPVPLNEEQKQVLMALEKPDCNLMILEGPPGTGKSHTITAIICKALLHNQSVLVLSDKKEALDVIEDKISGTLNEIRQEEDFQNPILRLGKTGSKFNKIVRGQTIRKIKKHRDIYRYHEGKYDNDRIDLRNELEENIKETIGYFRDIDINDIKSYFENYQEYSKIDWINSSEESKIDLLKIKESIEYIQKVCKDSDDLEIHRKLLDDGNYDLLEGYQRSLDNLSESKINFEAQNKNIDIYALMRKFDACEPYDQGVLDSLKSIKVMLPELRNLCKGKSAISKLFEPAEELDFNTLDRRLNIINISIDMFSESKKFLGEKFDDYHIFSNFEISEGCAPREAISKLKTYIDDLNAIKLPIIGFFFKKEKLREITRDLKKTFNYWGIDNPKNDINAIQQISDWFNFIYEKIPSKYKEEGCASIFNILIELLNKDNDKYLSDCKEIKKLQGEIVAQKTLVKSTAPSLEKINDLEYEIQQVTWNIKIFKEINNIKDIVKKLSKIIPSHIKIASDANCSVFFKNDISDSLGKLVKIIEELRQQKDDIDYVLEVKKKFPDFAGKINLEISDEDINASSSDIMPGYEKTEISRYKEYKKLELKLMDQFNSQPEDKFFNSINKIEKLTTQQMTHFMDKSIIECTEKYANDVETLKTIIQRKKKFPKKLFQKLKQAFPCILAGIRDYAEFIPLERDLFDLIIIDEASQVSIAQALPALVRGKKIVVLGDDKQFSNVKANNASKVTNKILKNRVLDIFSKCVESSENKQSWLAKVEKNFDIKNSILTFSRFIRNYQCQLIKHFRCYPEIISYSDKNFYDNTLQCMKIRGKHIKDVIKFDVIPHGEKSEAYKNINELEAQFIIEKLQEFKQQEIKQSLGIITPHREQVTLLFDKINELPEREWLFKDCKLKIMTFDTCQGEERDYIFYSMVATKKKDALNYIFLKDLSLIDNDTDGTIRSQRMNVGFSRAKECIHFVLSKPIEEFQGEIRNAMLHYRDELANGKNELRKKFDSPMEHKIDEIFHATKFYKDNKGEIEFKPQFELGKYLQRLENNYTHPEYRVDFLLLFNELKIVIEYDGFKEHFVKNEIDDQYYMRDEDIYRQKILEGYGYKFLRINRFNIGNDPIKTLDERLEKLINS